MALAFRGIWVLSSSVAAQEPANAHVIYAKRFACCETLCGALHAQPLPDLDSEVAGLFAARRHQLLMSSGAFALLQQPSYPSLPASPAEPPSAVVYQPLPTFLSPPICFICAHSVFIAGVPVCPDVKCGIDGSIDDVSVRPLLTATIWFLHTFSESLGRVDWSGDGSNGGLHVADFISKLCVALPMGRPSAFCEGASADASLSGKGFVPQSGFSWRPFAPIRAKKRLELKMREFVCAHIYGRADKADILQCSGIITCFADVEGSPDITLSITNAHALSNIRVHACAQRPEISCGDFTLSFSPPIDRFVLVRYSVDCLSLPEGALPFAAEYEALALPDGSAALSFSISVTALGASSALQLRVLLPLQGWSGEAVSSAKFSRPPPTNCSLEVHPGAQALVLIFPALSASLLKISIRVDFGSNSQSYPAVDMPFIQYLSTCALVQFSTTRLISGLVSDCKRVMCHPSMSLDCVADTSSASNRQASGVPQFFVWNKYGSSPDWC
jgi:hypothetical protein